MFKKNGLIAFVLVVLVIMLAGCNGGSDTADLSDPAGNDDSAGPGSVARSGSVATHTAVADFESIPSETIDAVKALNIVYWHTSHGSQLISGVSSLGSDYDLPNIDDNSGHDLGTSSWNVTTTEYLNSHPETDVVLWSWCGQASNDIDMDSHYLSKMEALETAFPDVTFIYMTGHLRGAYTEYLYDTSTNQRLQTNNGEIRSFCANRDLWLYDFADIESYQDDSEDQCMYDGMPVECTWPENTGGCSHSRGPNCLKKGKAFWWILARITGWEGAS